jgi:hypothetical protein
MLRPLLSRSLLAVLLLAGAGAVSAQTIIARGHVQDTGTVIKLMSTPLKLSGTAVNLAGLVGLDVELTGTLVAAQNLEVATSKTVTDVFSVGNNGVVNIGGPVKLDIKGPPGRFEQLHWALDNGFGVVKGMAWFLAPSATQLTQGVIPASGTLSFSFTVQNDPSLVGVKVFLQDVRKDGSTPFRLGNADSFTVQ